MLLFGIENLAYHKKKKKKKKKEGQHGPGSLT